MCPTVVPSLSLSSRNGPSSRRDPRDARHDLNLHVAQLPDLQQMFELAAQHHCAPERTP